MATKKDIIKGIIDDLSLTKERMHVDHYFMHGSFDDFKKEQLQILKNLTREIEQYSYNLEEEIECFEILNESGKLYERKERVKVKKKARRKK